MEMKEREVERERESFVETDYLCSFIFVVDANDLLFVLLHSPVCNQQFPPSLYK